MCGCGGGGSALAYVLIEERHLSVISYYMRMDRVGS